ncbi:2-phosphosulfolactate phosphatase [Brevibacillus sp. SYP-B805]|uniref:2-phosphosulfolactate phosphatase n=1 Tax=Brevibacillus sp. SYP-B805 TaxID=1578199 RepID=UPI0013ED71F0|nr:2-phosphosulfolactate phosphatase [Brevibacillus sp. SYP-B805]NGQ95725.1 2-phosphosulfolactate phosphatase [Brevibacillus sp. SYP-B805]
MARIEVFQQRFHKVRFEWGPEGVRALAPVSDIVVIIDVLSFTTCADVAVNRGGIVFPYQYRDPSAIAFAAERNARLAGKRGEGISLSPASLLDLAQGSRIVLPSPNGATCSFLAKDYGATVVAACLRNASAVADYINNQGGTVAVIAAGERWPDGSLRPALEDMMAAGAILSRLDHRRLSPEARAAAAVFHSAKHDLTRVLEECSSGQELIAMGYPEDIAMAVSWDASETVPILNPEGAFVSWKQANLIKTE